MTSKHSSLGAQANDTVQVTVNRAMNVTTNVTVRHLAGALVAVVAALGCHPSYSCSDLGTCETSAEPSTPGVSSSTVSSSPSEVSTPVTEDSGTASIADGTSGSSDSTTSWDTEVMGCEPVSERGCEGETPWCLGEGERTLDGGWDEEPRCVQCEEDSHCAFPYREQGTEGLCYNYECVACEPGSNRGCAGQLPYCVERVWAAPLGVDASAGAGETLSAGGSAGDTSGVGGSSGAQASVFECGECLEEAHCGDGAAACVNARCVECSRDEHCGSPQASKCDLATHTCVGCTDVGQCAHLAATPACDTQENTCVECTREESDACGGRVCNVIAADPGYQTCSGYREASTTQCGECVNDAQCRAGYRCVEETFRESGSDAGEVATGKRYCMALERELGANKECGDNRPFVGVFAAESENGVEGPYCRPQFTTCAAYAMFKNGPDIIPEGQPGEGLNTCNGHESCGLPGVADGFCVPYTQAPATATNRCTYECVSDLDCNASPVPVRCVPDQVPDETRKVCKVTTN
jgi:hypothetical protein